MIVTYTPQRMNVHIAYDFDGEKITATVDGQTDIFDFESLSDGKASAITSSLTPCPVLAAKRVDDELYVTLLRPISPRPKDPQLLDAWKGLWTEDLEVAVGG